MVYSAKTPDTMRFKHVAANIIAQTVVTRPLAVRLMQKVQQGDAAGQHDDEMIDQIRYLFGTNATLLAGFRTPDYFDPTNTALAYMAASVLHPNPDIQNRCKIALEKNLKIKMDNLGNELLTWFKTFLNTMPTSSVDGAGSPLFDAFVQGKALQETFIIEGMDPEVDPETGAFSQERRNALPIMYLGELLKSMDHEDKFDLQNGDFNTATYLRVVNPTGWVDTANELGMYKDVNKNHFKNYGTTASVYPVGKGEKVSRQDIIAVNKSAGTQDALIAFVQVFLMYFDVFLMCFQCTFLTFILFFPSDHVQTFLYFRTRIVCRNHG